MIQVAPGKNEKKRDDGGNADTIARVTEGREDQWERTGFWCLFSWCYLFIYSMPELRKKGGDYENGLASSLTQFQSLNKCILQKLSNSVRSS